MDPKMLRPVAPACCDPSLAGRVRAVLVVGVMVMALVPVVGVPGASAAGAEVAVFPGDSIQALVNANPEGTTFIIKAGRHLRQQVIPKDGDSFVGESGAILDGDGVATYAFGRGGVGVTVRGLIIEHYVPPLGWGVFLPGTQGVARDWVVEGNEVRYNSGGGIGAGTGWVVRNNFIHHNGQIGVFTNSLNVDVVFEGNEIAFNNTDHIDSRWEAGGGKFVLSKNLIVRGNYVHDNEGPGIWPDMNNINVLIEDNLVTDNYGPGINYEASYAAVIRDNVVEGNGFGWNDWIHGAGIVVDTSSNVEVYGNTVRDNAYGIGGIQNARTDLDDALYGSWVLKNLWVHDNLIEMHQGDSGIACKTQDPVWSTEWNNRFDYNTYTLGPGTNYYRWNRGLGTVADWQAHGQDLNGTWNNWQLTAPSGLRGRPAAGQITMSWVAPASTGGQDIRDYVIRYRPKGTGTWVSPQDGVSTALRADVTGLSNGVLYQFQVAARNTVSTGPWSHVVEVRAGVPTRPRDLVATAGTGEVQLTWLVPATASGADITDYVIRYRGEGATTWVTISDGKSVDPHAHVTGLANGATYQFIVAAKNARGVGVWSRVVEAEPRCRSLRSLPLTCSNLSGGLLALRALTGSGLGHADGGMVSQVPRWRTRSR